MMLTVDRNGMPTACRVVESSGYADLDEGTCAVAIKNARFTISPDAPPETMSFEYRMSTTWFLQSPGSRF
jgi:TonB family protein